MRIAIFEYLMIPTNAIGGCDRHIAHGLCDEHDFTVFAVEFDNPAPDRIEFVKVPAIRRPLFLLYITYHIMAPIIFFLYKRRNNVRFDLVQSVESNMLLGQLLYSQFCHHAYLDQYWAVTKPSGIRGFARWINHNLHAAFEPRVYRQASHVVVPSQGLMHELKATYPVLKGKIEVISNPIDVKRMARPQDFDRTAKRAELGLTDDDLALVFVALGHFERKGLPLLLDAISKLNNEHVKLIVIGGMPDLLSVYKKRVEELGIADQVNFVGLQKDIRPFLWAVDLFTFPSYYETFSLVSFEAAAAGLPLLVSKLHGVEDFLVHGENGWQVERTPASIMKYIEKALNEPEQLATMAQVALNKVQHYDLPHFIEAWRRKYQSLRIAQEQTTVSTT
jgi:glycosyltransferase involved in cell wall biosynthesis